MQKSLFESAGEEFLSTSLENLEQQVRTCRACPLASGQGLLGRGDPNPRVLFVGEAPTDRDVEEGLVFSGRAEGGLEWMLQDLGLEWSDVYLANIVACTPPNNREPAWEEIQACKSHLSVLIDTLDPWVIVAMGGSAAKALVRTRQSFGSMRGEWYRWQSRIPVRVTFHPVRLFTARACHPLVRDDMRAVKERLKTREGLENGKEKVSEVRRVR